MLNKEEKMKSYEFDEIATNVFGEAYPIIVIQAIGKTEISEGTCIDLGCGGGHLGIALAENADVNMKVYLYDIQQDAIDICNSRIKEKTLEDKVEAVRGNVESISLEDNSVDLAISRGSLWFWEDKVKAFKEIYRILKNGGKTYIGGGFGCKELREQINKEMLERDSETWKKGKIKKKADDTKNNILKTLESASIDKFEIVDDDSGYWIIISKEE